MFATFCKLWRYKIPISSENAEAFQGDIQQILPDEDRFIKINDDILVSSHNIEKHDRQLCLMQEALIEAELRGSALLGEEVQDIPDTYFQSQTSQ